MTMIFQVTNEQIVVGQIQMISMNDSALLKVGDTESIQLFSAFDTPPESLVIGPFAPVAPSTVV